MKPHPARRALLEDLRRSQNPGRWPLGALDHCLVSLDENDEHNVHKHDRLDHLRIEWQHRANISPQGAQTGGTVEKPVVQYSGQALRGFLMATPLPRSEWTFCDSWVPTTGKFARADPVMDCCRSGLFRSTNPSTVTKTMSSGKIEKNP